MLVVKSKLSQQNETLTPNKVSHLKRAIETCKRGNQGGEFDMPLWNKVVNHITSYKERKREVHDGILDEQFDLYPKRVVLKRFMSIRHPNNYTVHVVCHAQLVAKYTSQYNHDTGEVEAGFVNYNRVQMQTLQNELNLY